MHESRISEARATRYWLLVIIVAFIVLALVYSLAVPLFEGPDEIWHYAFANHLANGGGLPVFDATQPATFLRNGAHPPLYYALIAALIAPIDRADFPAEYRFNLGYDFTPQGPGEPIHRDVTYELEQYPEDKTELPFGKARRTGDSRAHERLADVHRLAR